MKHLTLLLAATCLLSAAACKKKDKDPDPAPTPTTPVVTSFDGIITTGNYTNISPSSSFTVANARAYFSSQPVAEMFLPSSIHVNSVFLNSDSLSFQSFAGYYIPNMPVSLAAETWSVSGANGIPSFTFANTLPFPTCSDLSAIPGSISKSAGLQLTISNVTNASSGTFVFVPGGSNTVNTPVFLKAGNNVINLTPASLASVSTNSTAMVAVLLSNSQTINVSGRNFKFVHEMQFLRQVSITN